MIAQTTLGGSFTFPAASVTLNRMGYDAMQLAGRDGNKLVWGLPPDIDGAIALSGKLFWPAAFLLVL